MEFKMENITKKETMTKPDKIKAMEKESNITLVSTAVAIVSFFFLLYAQNLTKTNAIVAQKFLTAIEILYLASAVGVILFAVIKKKSWLWEYAIFGIVMALGYYLMHHGVSGIPFLIKESGNTISISPFAVKLSKIIRTDYITYALWAINVLYCVLSIALHSIRYNKIKKTKVEKTN